jgi:tRNA pseudouridine(55) synthase
MSLILHKEVGETPLECLERARRANGIAANIPMTYAGRLDPMAEGVLLVLVGDECKEKEKFLGSDKEYEIEVLFGVATDTQDVLGVITTINIDVKVTDEFIKSIPEKYIGTFSQKYPVYSSKTVGGKALHTHARENTLPTDEREMPARDVKIYSIDFLGQREITGTEIAIQSIEKIKKVNGDFRQEEIIMGWQDFAQKYATSKFSIIKLKVKCSTGTYMRVLAERIGKDAGTVAIASSIMRTRIGNL